jgi:hypothetical protein
MFSKFSIFFLKNIYIYILTINLKANHPKNTKIIFMFI